MSTLTPDLRNVQAIVEAALLDLARYYRREAEIPAELVAPSPDVSKKALTKAWTKAEINYLDMRLSKEGLQTKRERAAGLRLPPDLVVREPSGTLLVHVERETRGWEWNHVFGALIKLMFCNREPTPIAVLVLDNLHQDRLEMLLDVCQRLLPAVRDLVAFYLALWLDQGRDARVFQIVPQRARNDDPAMRCLLPVD